MFITSYNLHDSKFHCIYIIDCCRVHHSFHFDYFKFVITLALGSRPRQGFARLWAKREAKNRTTYSRECEKVWRNEPSHPKGVPLWELKSRWTPEYSEGDCRGKNSMAWEVFYINGKLLEHRYLKWARIAHLDIWNTSYGQKKGQESNWQFDSRPLKVENQPDFRMCR